MLPRGLHNGSGYPYPVFVEVADTGYIGEGRAGEDAPFEAYIELEATEPQPLAHLGSRPVLVS